MAAQRCCSERRGEAYFVLYGEPLSDARTKLADFFTILPKGEFTTRQPPESRPSSGKERRSPLELPGRPCTPEVVPSERRLSHWRGNYSGRIHRRPCSGTIRRGALFCPDRAPACRLCSSGVQSPAASAPNLRHVFEYSSRREYSGALGPNTIQEDRSSPVIRQSSIAS